MGLVGKRVELKSGMDHVYEGHYGFVINESIEDDEYTVAGGSISTLNPDGTISGPTPIFGRSEFVVPRVRVECQFDKEDRMAYELWMKGGRKRNK